jgi:hypothetical protein
MTTTEITPYETFSSDATKRATLRSALENPVIREALEIVEDLFRPRCGTPADANQPLSIAKFHQSAGASEFLKKLQDLTRETKPVVKLSVRKLAKSEDDLPQ